MIHIPKLNQRKCELDILKCLDRNEAMKFLWTLSPITRAYLIQDYTLLKRELITVKKLGLVATRQHFLELLLGTYLPNLKFEIESVMLVLDNITLLERFFREKAIYRLNQIYFTKKLTQSKIGKQCLGNVKKFLERYKVNTVYMSIRMYNEFQRQRVELQNLR